MIMNLEIIMEYRDFNTITNEEIKFIINDLFNPVKIRDINRNKTNKDIVVDIFIMPNSPNINSTIILNSRELFSKDLYNLKAENKLYKQYLFSLGMNEMFKDNPYMNNNIEKDKEQEDGYSR